MTRAQIVQKLHDYYTARDRHYAAKAELVRIAVECGQQQRDALKHPAEFLDGWLAGSGSIPVSRAA